MSTPHLVLVFNGAVSQVYRKFLEKTPVKAIFAQLNCHGDGGGDGVAGVRGKVKMPSHELDLVENPINFQHRS